MISAGTAGLALGEAAGTAVGGPVGGAVVGVIGNLLTGGGAARDASRQTRVAWTLQMAQAGSITAAEIIIAAPQNVAGDEAPFWTAALSQVPPAVLAAARAQAPQGWWPSGQPDFYTDVNGPTHSRIVNEAGTAAATPTATAGGTVSVPRTAATAAAAGASSGSWMWYAVGGVVLLAVVVLVLRHRGRA